MYEDKEKVQIRTVCMHARYDIAIMRSLCSIAIQYCLRHRILCVLIVA